MILSLALPSHSSGTRDAFHAPRIATPLFLPWYTAYRIPGNVQHVSSE
jgi:hypothetical protein